MIVYASLYPGEFHFREVDGGPLIYLAHRWDSWTNSYLVRDIPANFALYFPVGLFALPALFEARRGAVDWNYKAKWLHGMLCVLFGFLLSVVLETLQIYESRRSSSAVDIVCNTAGAAFGVGLALLVQRFRFNRWNAAGVRPAVIWPLLVTWVALLLWPFQFRPAMNGFSFIPFATAITGDGPHGLLALAKDLAAVVPALWALRASGRSQAASTAIVASLLGGVEIARLFIPGAEPGVTNPLLAVIAGYARGDTGTAAPEGNATKR